MVASTAHIMPDENSRGIYDAMAEDLQEVADRIYGPGNYRLDYRQREITDHMHLHARPEPDQKASSGLRQPQLAALPAT